VGWIAGWGTGELTGEGADSEEVCSFLATRLLSPRYFSIAVDLLISFTAWYDHAGDVRGYRSTFFSPAVRALGVTWINIHPFASVYGR